MKEEKDNESHTIVGPAMCIWHHRRKWKRVKDEERSDDPDSAAVAPGEAREAIEWAMNEAKMKERTSKEMADECEDFTGREDSFGRHMERSYRNYVRVFESMLPKPDSEAPNERSGQRNGGS